MRRSNVMGPWVYFPVYCRRPYRNCPSKLLFRHCSTRHILRSCPFPLCSLNRGCICNYRGLCTLISTIFRVHPSSNLNKNSLWCNVCRCQPYILPTTLPRPIWNTPSLLRLPRCIHNLKHLIINWLPYLPCSRNHNNVYYLRSLCSQTRSTNIRTYKH